MYHSNYKQKAKKDTANGMTPLALHDNDEFLNYNNINYMRIKKDDSISSTVSNSPIESRKSFLRMYPSPMKHVSAGSSPRAPSSFKKN